MNKTIRKPRSYKIADKPYTKAVKRARGELATMIEWVVTEFGNDKDLDFAVFDRSDFSIKTYDTFRNQNNTHE